MTFNAASRLRSLEDRSAALGSRRCELPGMRSVPKSAVLPYASGVGGLSRRLLNIYRHMYEHITVHPGSGPTEEAAKHPEAASPVGSEAARYGFCQPKRFFGGLLLRNIS